MGGLLLRGGCWCLKDDGCDDALLCLRPVAATLEIDDDAVVSLTKASPCGEAAATGGSFGWEERGTDTVTNRVSAVLTKAAQSD